MGHGWVKRLFVDRNYKNSERAEDYVFVKAGVYDNAFLLENSPNYVRTLENLPEDRRKAMLYGDWDVYEGQYFSEFDRDIHTIEPFNIPKDWRRYFVMDYGLDMLAGYFVAVDELGRSYFYREIYQSGLIITDAIAKIKENTPADEEIFQYIAPPDMWNRRQDTGKSVADTFGEHGIYLSKARNDRVQGWYAVKEWLKIGIDEYGKKASPLVIFRNCKNLIRCIPLAQYDSKKPNDVASEPHEITHSCVTGDTMIMTPNGEFEIKNLINKNGEVYCWDGEKIVVSEIEIVAMTKPAAQVYEVELENGSKFKATEDHKVLTAAGWKMVCEIEPEDEVLFFGL